MFNNVLPIIDQQNKCDVVSYLRSYLLQMGLSEPFSNRANFNGISDISLKIDKVVQKAFIEVNEEGSEAAAVTGKYIVLAFICGFVKDKRNIILKFRT